MTLLYGSYPVNTDGSPTQIHIDAAWPQTQAIAVYNESAYAANVAFSGNVSLGLTAYYADVILLNDNFNGNITINPQSFLSPQAESNAPSSVVFIVTYGPNDSVTRQLQNGLPTGFPISLPRLQAIGNNVTTSKSQSITNDGNPAGTSLLEATITGQTGSTVSLTNDGILSLGVILSGVIDRVIQTAIVDPLLALGIAGHLVETLGNAKIDGTLEVVGVTTFDTSLNVGGALTATNTTSLQGAVTATNAANSILASSVPATGVTGGLLPTGVQLGAGVNLPGGKLGKSTAGDVLDASGATTTIHSSGSTNPVSIDAIGGIYITKGLLGRAASGDALDFSSSTANIYVKAPGGSLIYQAPPGTTQWSRAKENHGTISIGAGTTGTVTHGMGKVPDYISVTPNNGTAGSQTWALWNIGSTTFQIYNAANTVTYMWKCENY